VDASEKAIELVQLRSAARGLEVHTKVADLTAPDFTILPGAFDLILIAYYLQRDLFAKVKAAVRPRGVVAAIAHTPEPATNGARSGPGLVSCADSSMTGNFCGTTKDRRATQHIVGRLPRSWRGELCRTCSEGLESFFALNGR
jgi:hypothetical protein